MSKDECEGKSNHRRKSGVEVVAECPRRLFLMKKRRAVRTAVNCARGSRELAGFAGTNILLAV
jgi:hypothetical protein